MKNLKKIFQAAIIGLGLSLTTQVSAQSIPANFFGQNAWMPDSIGSNFYGGKLHQNWGKIQDSKVTLIRFGGIGADNHKPTNFQYIKMIDSVRAHGMEPVIQVPFHKGAYTAQQAAAIVQYLNVSKGKNIKYFSIGNEPDLDYQYTSAAQIAAYFKPFASAMKAVDPNILIVGPECAWYNQGIMDGLTTPNGPNDITGKDAAGRYYLDVISFHTYPFDGSQSREQMITKLAGSNGFEQTLNALNIRVAAANNAHNRTGSAALTTAVTEANVCYKNAANDNLNGVGVNSFIGGQFIAEMLGIGMKKGVSFMTIWSVIEGNSTELNIGYLDRTTGNKKPAYYHYQMVADNFKGNTITASSNQPKVKTFASQSSQFINVLIMNQELSTNHNFTVRLNDDPIAGNSGLKISANANVNVEYNGVINNQTSMVLTFNASGVLVKKTEYSLATHAVNNQAPTVTLYNGGVGSTTGNVATAVNENADDAVSMKGFAMNVFPNPANSKFTIEIDRPNKHDVKFVVEIYDIMGRLIHTQSSIFTERQQQVDLSGATLAEAVYIVRVREAADKDNVRATKIVIFK
jgi:hypothetical protein